MVITGGIQSKETNFVLNQLQQQLANTLETLEFSRVGEK